MDRLKLGAIKAVAKNAFDKLVKPSKCVDVSGKTWHLGREIARGGWGKVYECSNDQAIVVKIAAPERPMTMELEVYKSLEQSLYIPTFVAHGMYDGRQFMVLERYQTDVDKIQLKPSELNCMITYCLYALRNLHAVGYIHGDLKANNILVQSCSNVDKKYGLTDFGMSVPIGECVEMDDEMSEETVMLSFSDTGRTTVMYDLEHFGYTLILLCAGGDEYISSRDCKLLSDIIREKSVKMLYEFLATRDRFWPHNKRTNITSFYKLVWDNCTNYDQLIDVLL